MKLISGKEFIEKFGLDVALLVVSDKFYKDGSYYCHIYKHRFITIEKTYSDKPNINGAEWVGLSELNKEINLIKDMKK